LINFARLQIESRLKEATSSINGSFIVDLVAVAVFNTPNFL